MNVNVGGGGTDYLEARLNNTLSYYEAGVASLPSYVFYGCTALLSASFPNCTKVATYTFNTCTNLESVYMPNLQSIGNSGAFAKAKLGYIDFPNLTYIGSNTFQSCTSISWISLPKLASVNGSAFNNCKSMMSLYILTSSVPYLANTAFGSTPLGNSTFTGEFGSIFVLSSMLSAFQSATNWLNYSARMVGV